MIDLRLGDCIEVMREMDANSVDAIVTDPPYGLEFMGKEWDRLGDIGKISHNGISEDKGFKGFRLPAFNGSANRKCQKCGKWAWDYPERKCVCESPDFPNVKAHQARIMQDWHYEWAIEALRVAKPGAHLLAFGGTRTFHRLACAIEDAGWEIRDTVMWVYGSGFPKSHDVSKAIDKMAGAERAVVGRNPNARDLPPASVSGNYAIHGREISREKAMEYHANTDANITVPATDAAHEWEGWGTALKPAWEPVIVARKPLEGTVAANVLKWGTGAINIDGTRIPSELPDGRLRHGGGIPGNGSSYELPNSHNDMPSGRWPANLIHDGSDEVLEGFPNGLRSGGPSYGHQYDYEHNDEPNRVYGKYEGKYTVKAPQDSGSASRYFYCAKASKSDRDEGLEGMKIRNSGAYVMRNATDTGRDPNARGNAQMGGETFGRNHHPTVKPTELMRYLCRLITPPGGVILDPFMGSGSTGKAAVLEGFSFIGIEKEAEYLEIAEKRIAKAMEQMRLPI